MLEYLRLQNINSVVSCITVPNLASDNLHESMGFTLCGYFHNSGIKFNKLLDVKFYELILSNEVKEFIPFSNLKIIKWLSNHLNLRYLHKKIAQLFML